MTTVRILLLVLLALNLTALAAAQIDYDDGSTLPRHPLEIRALTEPESVLAALPEALAELKPNQFADRALLQLAKANACRVLADWSCQSQAGRIAADNGELAGAPVLTVRGLIAEARASGAQSNFNYSEQLLGRAEVILNRSPNGELMADVCLAYSSLSYQLGKYQLSLEYAQKGINALGGDQSRGLQTRLLRNLGRAQAQFGNVLVARETLGRAQLLAEKINDPKLRAELFLESARLARLDRDVPTQKLYGNKILDLAQELKNTQLAGLAHEVIGLSAQDDGDLAAAQASFEAGREYFQALNLSRDELRLARQLIIVMLDRDANGESLKPILTRTLELERDVIQGDRAVAADDFDARLKYAEQETELIRIETARLLAEERARALDERIAQNQLILILTVTTAIILGLLLVLQYRARRKLQEAYDEQRRSESKTSNILELSSGLMFVHDPSGVIELVNPATAEALGYSRSELVGRSFADLLDAESAADFPLYLEHIVKHGEARGMIVVRTRTGERRHWRYNVKQSLRGIVGTALDVTQEVVENENLRQHSIRDPLTQCYNRRYLEDFERTHDVSTWALLYIDLIGFKKINDERGHDQGDKALCEFADFLRRHVRDHDAVVRAGGDEFLVLLAGSQAASATALINRLIDPESGAPLRFRVGMATREGNEDVAATMSRADHDMYQRTPKD